MQRGPAVPAPFSLDNYGVALGWAMVSGRAAAALTVIPLSGVCWPCSQRGPLQGSPTFAGFLCPFPGEKVA